jgi:hypothetical protein
MKTFERELSWVAKTVNADVTDTVDVTRTKVATFKELNRNDPSQHKLHFKLISLFEGTEVKKEDDEESSIGISSDGLYDITVKAFKTLIVENDSFTEKDKKEFLSDSIALLEFGMWLFKEKFTPFFSSLRLS